MHDTVYTVPLSMAFQSPIPILQSHTTVPTHTRLTNIFTTVYILVSSKLLFLLLLSQIYAVPVSKSFISTLKGKLGSWNANLTRGPIKNIETIETKQNEISQSKQTRYKNIQNVKTLKKSSP